GWCPGTLIRPGEMAPMVAEGISGVQGTMLKVIKGQYAPEVVDDQMVQEFPQAVFLEKVRFGMYGLLEPREEEQTDQVHVHPRPNRTQFLGLFDQGTTDVPNDVPFELVVQGEGLGIKTVQAVKEGGVDLLENRQPLPIDIDNGGQGFPIVRVFPHVPIQVLLDLSQIEGQGLGH